MTKPISPCPRPVYRAAIMAAAMTGGLLLSACGGGGGGGGVSAPPAPVPGPPPSAPVPAPPPPAPAPGVSQTDATADAANALAAGSVSAQTLDTVYDTTAALALAVIAAPTAAAQSAGRAHAQAGVVTDTEVNISCPGGGTATFTIKGTDLASLRNGQFDAGEEYTLTYTACRGSASLAQLDGQADLTVTGVTGGPDSITPTAIATTIALTNLTVTLPAGSLVANGSGTLSRTSLTAGATATATSTIAASSLALATSFNSRTGSYAITNLAATRVATSTNSTLTGSTYSGTVTLTGTANSGSFALTSTTPAAVTFDTDGLPTAGEWTAVRSDATIDAKLVDGTVTLTVDDGSDGSVNETYLVPVTTLEDAAG